MKNQFQVLFSDSKASFMLILFFLMLACLISKSSFAGDVSLSQNYFSKWKKESEKKEKRNHVHLTTEFGLYANNLNEVVTSTFVNDLYQGSVEYIPGILSSIGGSPDDLSSNAPVFNCAIDFNLSQRFKIGLGVNGVPKVQVVGYVDMDSLQSIENNYYSQAEEIITATTAKLELFYVLKKYKSHGFGWELDIGGGVTYNFVNLKQEFITNTFDTVQQQWIAGSGVFTQKYSSVGAFATVRIDVYLNRNLSWVTDICGLYDTGIKINETTYTFNDVSQSISTHDLKLNAFLASTGVAVHF